VDVSKILRFHCKTSVAPIITKKLAKPRVSKCMLVGTSISPNVLSTISLVYFWGAKLVMAILSAVEMPC